MPEETERRALLVSKAWVQASVVVFLLGFFVLGLLAYRTYSADPPIPDRIVDPTGRTIFTGEDISQGQETLEEPEEILFTEITAPAPEATAAVER